MCLRNVLFRGVYWFGKTIGIMRVSESPSLRYFESTRKSWGRADRRSETKSGREGVRRFYERRNVLPIPPIRVRSNIPPFCPFPPCNLMVSSADGALPSVDSSPNTISLDLSLGQYSLRSNTVWPRTRQVKAPYRTQANRKQWEYSLGNADFIRPSADVVCHWSARILDPRCPVT